MERSAATSLLPRFEYKDVAKPTHGSARMRIAAFEREIQNVAATGYSVVSIERFQRYDYDGGHDGDPEDEAVMERRVGDGSSGATDTRVNDRFKLVEPGASKLQQHLNDYVFRGYRILVVHSAPLLLLERSLEPSKQPAYLVVRPTGGGETLQRDTNDAATRGFRLLRQGLFHAPTRGLFWKPSVGLIMEKPGDLGPQPEYLVIDAYRTSTLLNELADAFRRGFEPVGLRATVAASYIFLQRSLAR
jgi:hypothetical protein